MSDDERLLKRLRSGDIDAMNDILTRYMPYVVTVIINQLGERATKEDAEELAQNVFCSLWENRRSVRTDRLRGWLAAAARNSTLNFLRRHRYETVDIDDIVELPGGDNIESAAERRERDEFIAHVLDTLDGQSREIFLRHYYYGQNVSVIADEMSLGLSNVKSRLQRGRAKLRDELIKGGYCYES